MIDILLAAYNGSKYISKQIDSILCQTYEDWRLYISDDCSDDNTVEIVKAYSEKYPTKIRLIENTIPSGSARNHFFKMMKYSNAEYTMFCDQDDVWIQDKLQVSYDKMIGYEKKYQQDTPLLVHTDLRVVDENLNVISDSMFEYQSLDYERDKFNNLLVQNNVTGCTIMINRWLRDMVVNNIPQNAIMHDWWMALVASAFGHILFLDKPTVLYRQHGNNEVGAKKISNISYIISQIRGGNIKKSIENTYIQARCFLNIYFNELEEDKKEIASAYLRLLNLNKIRRIEYLYKYYFFMNSTIRKIGQILYI